MRDTPFTEKMDYFCASSVVLLLIFLAIVRLGRVTNRRVVTSVAAVLLVLFTCHIYYLGFIKMDYGYNMRASITVGIINLILWTLWAFFGDVKGHYRWKMVIVLWSTLFLSALEVLDFPPLLGLFDAHSIWHFCTIFTGFGVYCFYVDDATYELRLKRKNSEL